MEIQQRVHLNQIVIVQQTGIKDLLLFVIKFEEENRFQLNGVEFLF